VPQAKLIIGGEVGMWGEYVDENNFEGVVYPRAMAVGERLWSASTVTDTTAAKPRLLDQRCRMVQRGYRSAPVEPSYCASQLV
jgi:hexosaminidase